MWSTSLFVLPSPLTSRVGCCGVRPGSDHHINLKKREEDTAREIAPALPRRLLAPACALLLATFAGWADGAARPAIAVPSDSLNESRLLLYEDFGSFTAGGLPVGWTAWTPEPAMAMRIEEGSPTAYAGKNSVRMSGGGNQHAKGSIRRELTGLSAEKYYRFVANYSTQGIRHSHNSVYALVKWGRNQFRLLVPTSESNKWVRAEATLKIPANANGTVTIELLAGWIPDGSVYWGELSVTELNRYEPARNPVRVVVVDSKPPQSGSLLDNADFYAAEIARACKAERPDVIVFPEHFNTTQVVGDSEVTADSEYLRRLEHAAKAHRVNLVGSVHFRENGILFNTGILIDRQGKLAGKYHKSHLATPEALFTKISRGNELEVIETDFGKIGILVCWDYHFPEAVRTLVLKGAEILFVPLAGDGRLMESGVSMGIEYSGKAIALDNRVPIVFAVTQGSSKNPSMIINTQAEVVARSSDQEHIIAGVVDTKERVFQWTGDDFKSVYRSDRRPELYGPLLAGASSERRFPPDPDAVAVVAPNLLAGVDNAADWKNRRRPEIIELFRQHVYGRVPQTPSTTTFKVVERNPHAMGGMATLKRVEVTLTRGAESLVIPVTLFTPNQAPKPAPTFLLICNRGRENIDPTRQTKSPFWPAEEVVARGYGIAAFHNSDVDPDKHDGFRDGAHRLLDIAPRGPDAWGTIAAWAWGASRVLDYLVTDKDVAHDRVAVIGHSRGGKTALWAGAQDERFALVISNDSGTTGASLARRRAPGKESVARINKVFPHWFSENYKTYGDREAELPVDQHMLLALMAPRALAVGSADQDRTADPRGEFLSTVHASPAWLLFGKKGLGAADMPAIGGTIDGDGVHYHLRAGKHDLTLADWERYLDFADQVWANK